MTDKVIKPTGRGPSVDRYGTNATNVVISRCSKNLLTTSYTSYQNDKNTSLRTTARFFLQCRCYIFSPRTPNSWVTTTFVAYKTWYTVLYMEIKSPLSVWNISFVRNKVGTSYIYICAFLGRVCVCVWGSSYPLLLQ